VLVKQLVLVDFSALMVCTNVSCHHWDWARLSSSGV